MYNAVNRAWPVRPVKRNMHMSVPHSVMVLTKMGVKRADEHNCKMELRIAKGTTMVLLQRCTKPRHLYAADMPVE